MKHTPRVLQKNNWRSHIEKCWEVQNTLTSCISASEEFKSFSQTGQDILLEATSKGFIYDYLRFFRSGNPIFSKAAQSFYRRDSELWNKFGDRLTSLDEKCNIFALSDCVTETFTLENLDGNYEHMKRYFD